MRVRDLRVRAVQMRNLARGRSLDVQTFGALVVIGAFAAAEAAAAYLGRHPGSGLAWYLNLAVFRPFELARADTSPLHLLFGPAALPGALALLGLTVAFRALRLRLPVAVMANLGFTAAAALAYVALGPGPVRAAGPAATLAQGPDLAVLALMLLASALAFAASHLSFVDLIRDGR